MKAFVDEGAQLHIKDMVGPVLGKNEVLVELYSSGLNRRDLSIPNRRGDKADALILGSDGAGVVKECGRDVISVHIGDEVMINPSLNWEYESPAPPEDFSILGMPDHGTFAEEIAIVESQLIKKPKHFTWEEAGVFSLSALTAYRALITKGGLQAGQTVFIPGAGSGVASFLIQLAKSVGGRVIVSSRSIDKQKQAKKLGADVAIDTACDWDSVLSGERIDLVIDSVGRATFNRSLSLLKKGGRIVVFGATTEDDVTFDLRAFFYGQYHLLGSTMGSKEELQAALNIYEKDALHPVVDKTFTLGEADLALSYLDEGKQFGKVGIQNMSK